MFLETSYFYRIYDVDINNLAGYEERTRVLYMIQLIDIYAPFLLAISKNYQVKIIQPPLLPERVGKNGSYKVRGYVPRNQLNYYFLHR